MKRIAPPPSQQAFIDLLTAAGDKQSLQAAGTIDILFNACTRLVSDYNDIATVVEDIAAIMMKFKSANEMWRTMLTLADKQLPNNEYVKDMIHLNEEQLEAWERDMAAILSWLTDRMTEEEKKSGSL